MISNVRQQPNLFQDYFTFKTVHFSQMNLSGSGLWSEIKMTAFLFCVLATTGTISFYTDKQ